MTTLTTYAIGFNISWKGLCYANSQYVAVASLITEGTYNIATSPDGTIWTNRVTPLIGGNSICYGNSTYVTVGSAGTQKVMTSSDGITWTGRDANTNSINWLSVCFGNSLFVAVGGGTQAMTSSNGTSWNSVTGLTNDTWKSVCYGNSRYVAVALGGNSAYSLNGSDWVNVSTGLAGASVCYGNGLFVAVLSSGALTVIVSTDGTSWTAPTGTTLSANTWNCVVYNGTQFVALATGSTSGIGYSTDGQNWTMGASITSNTWNAIAFNGSQNVAVSSTGNGNRYMTSSNNGTSWTIGSTLNYNVSSCVCYGGGKWIMVNKSGTTGSILTSTNAQTWTNQLAPNTNTLASVCYGTPSGSSIRYVAISSVSDALDKIITSDNGVDWTTQTSAPSGSRTYASICYGNNLFVAVASSNGTTAKIMTSSNGTSWTFSAVPQNNQYRSVCYGISSGSSEIYVAVSSNGTNRSMWSADGTTFWTNGTTPTLPDTVAWQSVCYGMFGGSGLFVAVGNSGTTRVMTSPDGKTWLNAIGSVPSLSWVSVAFGNDGVDNGLFVAVASDDGITNGIMTSTDGQIWTQQTNVSTSSFSSVAFGNDGTNNIFSLIASDGVTTMTLLDNSVICFNQGTKILCIDEATNEEIWLPIETLTTNTLVKTYQDTPKRISKIGKRHNQNNKTTSKLKNMYQHKNNKLIVTGGHSVLVDELTEFEQEKYKTLGFADKIKDKQLALACYSNEFVALADNNIYTYYHFVLEGEDVHYGVWADGVLTESCGRICFISSNMH